MNRLIFFLLHLLLVVWVVFISFMPKIQWGVLWTININFELLTLIHCVSDKISSEKISTVPKKIVRWFMPVCWFKPYTRICRKKVTTRDRNVLPVIGIVINDTCMGTRTQQNVCAKWLFNWSGNTTHNKDVSYRRVCFSLDSFFLNIQYVWLVFDYHQMKMCRPSKNCAKASRKWNKSTHHALNTVSMYIEFSENERCV